MVPLAPIITTLLFSAKQFLGPFFDSESKSRANPARLADPDCSPASRFCFARISGQRFNPAPSVAQISRLLELLVASLWPC